MKEVKKQSESNTNRIEFVDIAKAIAIFLVCLGHTVNADSEMKSIIYSFHMPLFFILSGFFVRPIENYSLGGFFAYIKKKWVALMVPYILWGIIYARFSFVNVAYLCYGSYATIGSSGSLTSLWFLPVLFLSFIYIYPIQILKSKFKYNSLVIMLFSLVLFSISFLIPDVLNLGYPWGVNVAFFASGFLLIGQVVLITADTLSKKMILIILLLASLVFYFTCRISTSPIGYMRMADAIYGNPMVCIANSILGSVVVIFSSIVISWLKFPIKWISIIGTNTLGIFLVHKPFIGLFKSVFTSLHFPKDNMLIVLLIAILALICSLLTTLFLSSRLPIILGKTK